MDKNTMSNHGWIVIVALVLVALIGISAVATGFIKDGVNSSLDGFGQTITDAYKDATETQNIEVEGLGTITVKNPNNADFTYDSATGILSATTPPVTEPPVELENTTPLIEFTAGIFESDTTYTPGEYELESYEVTETRTKQPVSHKGGYQYAWIYIDGVAYAHTIDVSAISQKSTYLVYQSVVGGNTTVDGTPGNTILYRVISKAEDDTLENAIYLAAYEQEVSRELNGGNYFSWDVAKWNGTKYEDVDCRAEIDAITDFTETYTKTVTKTVVISRPSSSTEYVYVPSGTMKAEEGMTWAEWSESDYNTLNYDVTTVWDADFDEVALDSEIVAGESYGFAIVKNEEKSDFPFTWNTMDVVGNASFMAAPSYENIGGALAPFVKISDYDMPPIEEFAQQLLSRGMVLTVSTPEVFGLDHHPLFLDDSHGTAEVMADGIYVLWFECDGGHMSGETDALPVIIAVSAYEDIVPEAGLYFYNVGGEGISMDVTIAWSDSTES